jgi:lipid-A-disaccharide synthase
MAKAIRGRKIPARILYYISPQVWAWHRSRIPRMAELLDLMICIFPFEKGLYEQSGLRTTFAGHPMVDKLREHREPIAREADLVALLPGSREREVRKLFPEMVEAAKQIRAQHPETRFAAAAVSSSLEERMKGILRESGCAPDFCEVQTGTAHHLMQRAGAGVVASGTATLEAAFYGLPYCLVYKVALPTYYLGKWLVQVDYLGMVNILAGREVVREFIQGSVTPENIATEVMRLLESKESRESLRRDMAEAVARLGVGGAYRNAAAAMLKTLSSNTTTKTRS